MGYFHAIRRSVGGKWFLISPSATAIAGYWNKIFLDESWKIPEGSWIPFAIVTVAWIIVGLAIMVVRQEQALEHGEWPDMSLRDAFQYLLIDSESAVGTEPQDDDYYPRVSDEIRSAAHMGRLVVWGRPYANAISAIVYGKETVAEIDRPQWATLNVDLVSCVKARDSHSRLVDFKQSGGVPVFGEVQVNRSQVLRIWPKPGLFQRLKDWGRKRQRKAFQVEELQGYG